MNRYSIEELAYLKEGFKHFRVPELTEHFNRTFHTNKRPGQINACLKNHRFRCGRSGPRQKELLTLQQRYFVEILYKDFPIAQVTQMLNTEYGTSFSVTQITGYVHAHGINCGRTGQFDKGSTPWNTGTKGLVKPNSGQFKKGHTGTRIKPLGSERINLQDNMVLIKVAEANPHTRAPNRWKYKNVHLWEQVNGPVPDGHVIRFKDGDNRNFDIDNLVCITKRLSLRLNQVGYYDVPAELKEVVMTTATLEVEVFKRLEKLKSRGKK